MRIVLAALTALILSACNSLPVQQQSFVQAAADTTFIDTVPQPVWVVVKYVGNWSNPEWNPPMIIRRNTTTGWRNSTVLNVNPATRIGMTGWNYWTGDMIVTDITSPEGGHLYTYTYLTSDTTITVTVTH